jgi:3-dehydroquinate synthase
MSIHSTTAHFGERSYNLFYGSGAVDILDIQLNYKTLETVEKLYLEYLRFKVTKKTLVISFGGGVLQDLVNFTAATYFRGIPFIQIPTTLLSQVDIGIGGCAVDHPSGKSLIGTFYQPRLAILDTDFLSTLQSYEIRNGIAEIINKVICLSGQSPSKLRDNIPKILSLDAEVLSHYIMESNALKISIIERDETGLHEQRFVLDFGHTLTYAIERSTHYTMPHGFALGIGMRAALLLSEEKCGLSSETSRTVISLIEQACLPIHIPENIKPEVLLSLMHVDQKVKERTIRFILISDIGHAFVSSAVSDEDIMELLIRMYK